MQVIKRTGETAEYNRGKIVAAVEMAFQSIHRIPEEATLNEVASLVESSIFTSSDTAAVEQIQDAAEQALMRLGYYDVAKSFILYREQRARKRTQRNTLARYFTDIPAMEGILADIQRAYPDDAYSLELLYGKFFAFQKPGLSQTESLKLLLKAAVELTTQEAPDWEMIAARLLMLQFELELTERLAQYDIHSFYEKIRLLEAQGLYGKFIPGGYTRAEINACEAFIDDSRNHLLTYSGLDLLLKRYVIRDRSGHPLETPQEMFLGIALHLALPEKTNRLTWVKRFYDMLSTLQITMATPTLSNARKPFHQLSSCFIDTVPDSLDGIYRSIDNFAKVSKYGGGMGMYFGKVRAAGSPIRGFEGAAGGIIRWIRLANDTAVAVDQLGMRQGSVAVYLDVWHRDLPEFLALRTNNGDDRMKAHDVFPAVCYPDYFWEQARDHLESDWYLMCPHEIKEIKGYALEDSWGDEWKERYLDCVADPHIVKRIIPIKDLVRLIIKSAVETGTPFAFNRDTVNRANPNPHKGMIYSSNLCTEIMQNMGEIQAYTQSVQEINGEQVVVSITRPGEFVVCNLASLSLGRIDINDDAALEEVTRSAVRALDNVIDLNFFPVPYAEINNRKYRPVGLGVSGYHHMLARQGLQWESDAHLQLADKLFEKINYYAISASCDIAAEKGSYSLFQGSDWQNGEYFKKRNYTDARWTELAQKVSNTGLRNAYLLAIAPTSSTSIIAGTTAGIDPIMNRYFLEEKKNGLMPRVAPELNPHTFWLYKNAHLIDQTWSVRAAGVRQRHIDQSQSLNLYITNEYTFRQVLNLYLLAFEQGVKTVYYIRSKSLEVEECETCSS